MIRTEIKKYIETQIIPLYDAFDRAHGRDHAQTVIEQSAELASHYDVDFEMVYVVAAFHDVGLSEGRERHHIVSGEIFLRDEFMARSFGVEQREIMRDAMEDHRASSKSDPRTIYGMIVAEADRVISPQTTLLRTVQYGLKQQPDAPLEWHYERFCGHLMKKYAEGGYLKLYIPYSQNAERLEELRAIISDKVVLRAKFEELFLAEVEKNS